MFQQLFGRPNCKAACSCFGRAPTQSLEACPRNTNAEECLWISLAPPLPWRNGCYVETNAFALACQFYALWSVWYKEAIASHFNA